MSVDLEPTYKLRRDNMSGEEMQAQIDATTNLVHVLNQRINEYLVQNTNHEDLPDKMLYEAFFENSEMSLVLQIDSVRLPNQESGAGLFLDIYDTSQGVVRYLVRLQTAKVPQMVDRDEAIHLSRYLPGQLNAMAELVQSAQMISRGEFDKKF